MPNVIEIIDVSKRYGALAVLDHVSASVPRGEIVGLLGHNGAGKTTLIKLALGLIRPSAGEIRVLGALPHSRDGRRLRAHIGYLPENVAFYGNLTGREVIAYLARLKCVAEADGLMLLERLGLHDAVDKRVRTYSKGMRQRLGLAQALLGSPELFFLDEPTGGLDPLATQQFFEIVRGLRAEGKTVVISSHLLAELEPHLDRAIVLKEGRLLAQGTLAAMKKAAGMPVTIRARLPGKLNGLLQEPWLAGIPAAPQLEECGVLELAVPPGRKMDVLRHLMNLSSLADVTVKEPSLARLYATIGGGTQGGSGDA